MTEMFKRIQVERNQEWIHWKGEVIIDEEGKRASWIGRNFAYKPIVVKRDEFLLGEFKHVHVNRVFPTYLEADIINR